MTNEKHVYEEEEEEETLEEGNDGTPEDGGGDQEELSEDSGAEESLRDTLNEAIAANEGDENSSEDGDIPTDGEKPSEEVSEAPVATMDAPFDGEDGKSFKAPASWKPNEREHWSKVPVELQARIKAREMDIDRTLQETAQARQTHEFMSQLGNSYAPLLAAEGMPDVTTGVKGMFETIALLQNGAPEMKAQKMAQLIQHYGVDINALDQALVGEQPTVDPNYQVQQIIDQRLQPVNQLLEQINQSRQQQYQVSQQQADREVDEFKGEFLADVRLDMADIIDAAAARGQQMTLQKAYDVAISVRPDIQKVINERKQREAITGQQERVGQKMNAASSISGNRGGIASGNVDTIRGVLEDAWNDAI